MIIVIKSQTKEMLVRIGNDEVAKAPAEYSLGIFDAYYLGGLPQSLREKCATLSIP